MFKEPKWIGPKAFSESDIIQISGYPQQLRVASIPDHPTAFARLEPLSSDPSDYETNLVFCMTHGQYALTRDLVTPDLFLDPSDVTIN